MELSDNKIFRTVQANPDNYAAGNYELYGELRVEKTPGSGLYQRTLTVRLSPNLEDKATFELQDGIADFFPLPDLDPASVTAVGMISDNQVRAQFYTTESYGDPASLKALNLTANLRILRGGVSKMFDGDFFGTYLPSSRRFLTWHPGKKRINQEQPEMLHFYAYAGITQIKLLLKVYFTDQSSQTLIKSTTTGINQGRIYRIPASFEALGVNEIDPEKQPVKYEVWLRDQSDEIIAQPVTYIIEQVPRSTSRYWMFLNSLGMWEIMRTEGKAFKSISIDREMSAGYLQQGYSRTRGEIRSRVMGSANELECSTGYLDSREEGEWAQEILLSDKVFLLENGLRIPYVITSGEYEMARDQEYKWFLRFTAQLAYNNTRFSRL